MKNILKLEEVAMLALSIYFYALLDFDWWWYLVLFFLPDISFVAYALNAKIGAYTYNILHHKGLMLLIYFLGIFLHNEILQMVGLVFFGHASFDRIFGYGLKYEDSFNNTHLGPIGKIK